MKKKASPSRRPAAKRNVAARRMTAPGTKPGSLTSLVAELRQLIQSARRGVASVVDTLQVLTNFEIGRRIVEHEQRGGETGSVWCGSPQRTVCPSH